MKNIDNILDRKESIFFFRFSEGSAHVREHESSGEATTHEKRGRQSKEKKRDYSVYGRSCIIKFEVPFLVLPQNKSWNDIQQQKTLKLNFKTRVEA